MLKDLNCFFNLRNTVWYPRKFYFFHTTPVTNSKCLYFSWNHFCFHVSGKAFGSIRLKQVFKNELRQWINKNCSFNLQTGIERLWSMCIPQLTNGVLQIQDVNKLIFQLNCKGNGNAELQMTVPRFKVS